MVFDSNYTIPKMIRDSAEKWPEVVAQYHKIDKGGEFQPVLYREMFQFSLDVAAGLMNIGVNRGDLIGLIADNRAEWLYTSIAINGLGAIDVPRGCDATPNDLVQILGLTEIKIVFTENGSQINKIVGIKDQLPCLEKFIVFDSDVKPEILDLAKKNNVEIIFYKDILTSGQKWRIENPGKVEAEFDKGKSEDICTIIFTSGTTGTPKGVQLTHGGYLAQLDEIPERIYLNPGDKALSVLPVWHVFEREVEYVIMIQGGTLCYSKPVGSILLADFKAINPHILPAVPRVFEAVYDGVTKKMRKAGGIVLKLFNFFVGVAKLQKKMSRLMFNQNACFTRYTPVLWWILFIIPWSLLWPLYWLGDLIIFRKIKSMLGTNFRAGIAGGGAYPKIIDEFFWAIGVEIVEGYGLSETSPIVAVRPIAAPIYRTIGSPIRGVQVRIVDPVDGFVLERGKQGVLQIKGPTVMKGYYKRPDLTAKVINEEGWLDTGDLAVMTIHNELQIRGRIKDTIVLRGGENLEPVPIETKLSESRFIKQAVVLGQDMRYLGALILVDEEELKSYAEENGMQYDTFENFLQTEAVQKLYETEIATLISSKNGFKMFERVAKFQLITKPFEVGVELSAKQEIMRFRINEIYKDKIAEMFTDNDN